MHLEISSGKCRPFCLGVNVLTHWGRDKMAAIFQTTFSNAFPWMKVYEFRLRFLKFVPKGPINNSPSLVQMMAWRRPGDKPLSKPMIGSLLTHICVTRPQWVKIHRTTLPCVGKTHAIIRNTNCDLWMNVFGIIEQSQEPHNAPAPYPIIQHPEQKCEHFRPEWCIVRYGAGVLWDSWDWSISWRILWGQ